MPSVTYHFSQTGITYLSTQLHEKLFNCCPTTHDPPPNDIWLYISTGILNGLQKRRGVSMDPSFPPIHTDVEYIFFANQSECAA
jgi:hypothetical protein